MKNNILSIFLLLLIFVSCTEKNEVGIFCDRHKIITEVNECDTIGSGEILIPQDTSILVNDMYVLGNYVVFRTRQANKVITVYNTDGKYLGAFGSIGNARNEFTGGFMANQQYADGKFWGFDSNVMSMQSFDIEESLKMKVPVASNRIAIGKGTVNAFYINDTTIVYDDDTPDNMCLKIVNPVTKKARKSVDLYEPHKSAISIYCSRAVINEQSGRLVMAMMFVNQVNFMSLDGEDRTSVSLYENATVDDSPTTLYYRGVASVGKYVCALYTNQKLADMANVPQTTEVHVFDWDGNFHKKLVIKDALSIIAFDKDGNMYGLDKDGNVRKCNDVGLN